MTTLTQASREWASRPADERFLSLTELRQKVAGERERSISTVVSSRRLEVQPHPTDPIKGITIAGDDAMVDPTHWSFSQLANLAGAPAGYLRKLPAPLVADAMNYGLRFMRDAEEIGILRTDAGAIDGAGAVIEHTRLRAATGPRYGRVWNEEIVTALEQKFGDGRTGDFRVPGEFGKQVEVDRNNTTIYGSDRDIFIFLADEENRIEMPNRRNGQSGSLARGFFVWNSEVGSQSIGAAFFLFDYVCKNRIVWGAQDFKEIRLRHTKSAPDRWLEEVSPVLMEYAAASAGPIEETIREAQKKRVDDDLERFLRNRFSTAESKAIQAAHEREEGRPIETVWDVVTGATAHAKTIEHQDARVDLERKGGKLLDLVSA
jgi:hypothetical protein